ncbi:MAG TPA: threonine/homoserine exporter RhtA [Steroidobacteraceae bacterium]|nr:threonine/homoserine exporter RhtA [Steroidobacteraceae bacterium]
MQKLSPVLRPSPVVPICLLLIAMGSIQAGASLAKTLFQTVGAPGAVALRTALATIMLVSVLRPWRTRVTRASWPPLLMYGVSLGVMNFLYYMALRTLPLGIAVSLEFAGPLAVAMCASRRPIDFVWIVFAAAGLILLLPVHSVGIRIDPTGALFALGAGACWACYIIFGQKTGSDYGAQAVALGSLIASLIVVPIGIASSGARLLAPQALPYGLAIALLSTALPYTLEMLALTRLPARTFGILMSIEPVFGALCGWALLSERLAPLQWSAIALIIVASIGTTSTTGRQRRVPVPMPE